MPINLSIPTELGLGEWILIGSIITISLGFVLGWLVKSLSKRKDEEIIKDLKNYQQREQETIDWEELKRRVENEE